MDVLMRYCLPSARQMYKNREQKYKQLVSQQDLLIHDSYSNTVLGKSKYPLKQTATMVIWECIW